MTGTAVFYYYTHHVTTCHNKCSTLKSNNMTSFTFSLCFHVSGWFSHVNLRTVLVSGVSVLRNIFQQCLLNWCFYCFYPQILKSKSRASRTWWGKTQNHVHIRSRSRSVSWCHSDIVPEVNLSEHVLWRRDVSSEPQRLRARSHFTLSSVWQAEPLP